MKRLMILTGFLLASLLSFSQVIDKEKLLEFYQTQRYGEAAKYLETVYDGNTNDIRGLSQLAYCYLMAGNLAMAEQRYLKIDSLQPNTVPILFSLASVNSRRGNRLKTRTYLEKIVSLDSNNFNALKQLSSYTDSIELKMKYLLKANRLNASDADVATDLAQVMVSQKQYLSAYRALETAINADTGNYVLLKAQMPVANELKKYKEVVMMGEKLLANGAGADVVKDLAKAYFYLKNYDKSIKLFQKLENLGMQNELTFYYTCLAYRELKNYGKATAYAKKTIEESISPNVSTYYSLLAGIYEMNQQLALSANAYKKGLTFSPNGTIYYRLGLLYDLKLNEKASAKRYYQLYINGKPNLAEEKEQVDYAKSRLLALRK